MACWSAGWSHLLVHVLCVLLMGWTVMPRTQRSTCGNAAPVPWGTMICSPSTSFLGPDDRGNLLFVAFLEDLVKDKHGGACPVGIIHSKMLEHGWSQIELQLGHSSVRQLYPYTITVVIHTLSSFYPFSLVLCTPSAVFASLYADGFV